MSLNEQPLSFGSSTTHLRLADPFVLDNLTLNTDNGSLTLSGTLALINGAQLLSSGGTLTLNAGGTASTGTQLELSGTTLNLQEDLTLTDSTLTANAETIFSTNGNSLALSGSTLEVEGTLNLSGVVPDNTSVLTLTDETTLGTNNVPLTLGTLNLADFSLTLDNSLPGLTVTAPVVLDNETEQLLGGQADLSLQGGVTVGPGMLASTGGTLTMGNLMIAAQGVVNLQGGSLQLPNGASVSTGGTLETSGATLELADNLTVSGTWNATGDTLRLLDNTSLSTTTPVTLETLDLNGANLELATATTSLTVQNAFTLDNSTLHTNNGSLTLASPTEIHSLLDSTGGTLEFQQGGTVSGTVNAQGSTLKLGGNLAVPGTLQMHLEATLDADMASLDLSGGTFELGGVLPLDQVQTDNLTKLKLLEDATVTRNEGFVVGAVDFAEFTLTLGSAATDLTLEV
ncbi:MAG: hypothetical protein QF614_07015, partial [SAR324 cluster bacterium]|nr:hypothetical protein [SAR324 cluster bacterium]